MSFKNACLNRHIENMHSIGSIYINQEFFFIHNIPKYAQHNVQLHLMHTILCIIFDFNNNNITG